MKTRFHLAAPLMVVTLAAAGTAWAQPAPPEQLGHVAFANSCKPQVQAKFERAVALLHSFWFREGEKAFRDVLAQDPGCAIATWGIATVLIGNTFATGPTPAQAEQARAAIDLGRAITTSTERERAYIDAVAQYYEPAAGRSHGARIKSLSDAFESVAKQFPDDDEAQTFWAIYLTATQDPAEQTFAASLKAAGILEAQFKKHPEHPGVAHYLIHSYDYPPIAAKGLDAARKYAGLAPSAPHAQHMPSHIFTRVGAWQDSADSNLKSAAVAKAEKEFGDQLHAMDYMVYAFLQLARDKDARALVDEAPGVRGPEQLRSVPYAQAAIPARYAIERGAWKEAAQLQPQPTRFAFTAALTQFTRALGAARSGDAAAAQTGVDELARIVETLKAAKDAYWSVEVEVQRLGAAAWTAWAAGNRQGAMELMQAAANLEDKSEKNAVSPGRVVPAHELFGDMLMEAGKPAEALVQYEVSQVRDPNRYRSLYGAGEAAAQAGNRDKARYYFARLAELARSGEPRPETDKARRYLAAN